MVNLSAASRTNRSRSVVVSPDEQHGFGVKYWEIIADNLKKRGWSLGYVSAVDSQGRTIWIADAHRGDGQRFIVRADEKLTAFVELEICNSLVAICLDGTTRLFQHCVSLSGPESGGGLFPAGFFAPSGPAIAESTQRGKRKEESIWQ